MNRLKLKTKIICSFGIIIVLCCFFVMTVVFTNIAVINALHNAETLPTSEEIAAAVEALNGSLLIMAVFAVFALGAVVALAMYMSNNISTPLGFLAGAIQGIAQTGNIYLDDKSYKTSKLLNKRADEIGQISRSVGDMLAMFRSKIQALNAVANGDLTVDIAQRSDKDTIGAALDSMVASLSGMFVEIQSVANQVSDGSTQLADGASALAQGSEEQAAVVERLSSSISSIAGMTTHNAEMAREAAGLSGAIKERAETGGEQMEEMIKAVSEINEASEAISKVIKIIDDIAFQTNILALNAAVEAARAGQHGKGFAVVAAEVRNLAAKSAEAARDTGSLISDSINKAKLGSKIAGETAGSLHEIVTGVNKSAQLVGEIARFSDEQASAITQINNGIEQVNRVVQQNNETAAQSASASKEVSGQSAFLEGLISRFKIKNALQDSSRGVYLNAKNK